MERKIFLTALQIYLHGGMGHLFQFKIQLLKLHSQSEPGGTDNVFGGNKKIMATETK